MLNKVYLNVIILSIANAEPVFNVKHAAEFSNWGHTVNIIS
jgi:hypothetical protein